MNRKLLAALTIALALAVVFSLPAATIQAAPSPDNHTTSEAEGEEEVVQVERDFERYYYGVEPSGTSLVEESAGAEIDFERYYYGVEPSGTILVEEAAGTKIDFERYYYGVGSPKTSLVEESAGAEIDFERYYYGVEQ